MNMERVGQSEAEKVLSHGEKIERGENGVINIYRAKGMFNGDNEYFSDVSTQKAKENLKFGDQEERN